MSGLPNRSERKNRGGSTKKAWFETGWGWGWVAFAWCFCLEREGKAREWDFGRKPKDRRSVCGRLGRLAAAAAAATAAALDFLDLLTNFRAD